MHVPHHLVVRFKAGSVHATDGTFSGYASIFGNVDSWGDIVEPGAFLKTLNDQNGTLPLTADHSFMLKDRLGLVTAREDGKGLAVEGVFNLKKRVAKDAYSDLLQMQEHGQAMGMSFSYDAIKREYDEDAGTRRLKEVRVYEVSLTQYPANELAGVTDVKAILDGDNFSPEQMRILAAQLQAKALSATESRKDGNEPRVGALATANEIAQIKGLTETLRAMRQA